MVRPVSTASLGDSQLKIYEEIGSGSFGKVYRAYDPVHDQVVAVKMIQLDISGDISSFLLELKFLRELKCRNITQVLSSSLHDSVLWVCMEYCAAGSCTQLLKRWGTFQEVSALYVLHETLLGLVYIHSQRKIHRDLKSANILITARGEVKIADFGVSAQLSDQMPQRDTFMGTPYWMAPEIIKCEKYGTAVDIWSLGIVAIELMIGIPPLRRHQPNEVIHMIESRPPPQLPSTCRASQNFRQFVSLCLQKRPQDRPSAEKLLNCNVFDLGFGYNFTKGTRYMPQPAEFKRMVSSVVRQRKVASVQNAVHTRTAADIDYLAPAKTLHSRDNCDSRPTNPESFGEGTGWDFTKNDRLERAMQLTPSPYSEGPSPSSKAPLPSPPSNAAQNPRASSNVPLQVWNRRNSRLIPGSSSPAPAIPARSSSRVGPVELSPGLLNQQHRRSLQFNNVPAAVPQKVSPNSPHSPLVKKATYRSEEFESLIRPAINEVHKRSRWPPLTVTLQNFTNTFEAMDRDVPGFTKAFIEELLTIYKERRRQVRGSKDPARLEGHAIPDPPPYQVYPAGQVFQRPTSQLWQPQSHM